MSAVRFTLVISGVLQGKQNIELANIGGCSMDINHQHMKLLRAAWVIPA